MPVEWSEFEAVESPQTDWSEFEPVAEVKPSRPDLAAQMASARREGRAASAALTQTEIGENFLNTLRESINPITAIPRLGTLIGKSTGLLPPETHVPSTTEAVLSPEQAKTALDFLTRGETPTKFGTGVKEASAELLSGLTTPEMMATIPAAGPSPIVRSLFAGQMASQAPEAAEQLLSAQNAEEAGRAVVPLAMSTLAPAAIALHANAPTRSAAESLRNPLSSFGEADIAAYPITGGDIFKRNVTVPARPVKNRPVVPETAPEPRVSMLQEIRDANADTTVKVQQLFPAAQLTREQAANLRRQAFSQQKPPTTGEPNAVVLKTEPILPPVLEPEVPPESTKQVPAAERGKETGQRGGKAEEVVIEAPKEVTPEPTTTTAPPADVAAELVGMGGAVPPEFKPAGGTPTAIKNAMVEADRKRMGLPSFEPAARQDYPTVWEEAMTLIDRDPGVQDALIADLKANPRALKNQTESALLHHRLVDLKNEYAKSTRELAQAYDEGRLDDVSRLKNNVQIWSDRVQELTDVTKSAGREWGRTGVARQQLAADDFSLLGLELKRRADRGGAPITDAERAELKKVADDHKARVDELEAHLAAQKLKLVDAEIKRASAEAKAQPQYHPSILAHAERIVVGFEKRADAAAIRLKQKLAQLGAGVDPTIVLDLAEIGVAKLGRIALDVTKWSELMIREYGPKIEPFLKESFEAAQKLLEKDLSGIKGPQAESVKRTVKKTEPVERATEATEGIKTRVEKGETDSISSDVQKLVRAIVEGNPKISRDALIDEVHSVLKGFIPDMTRLEAMDSISGRGKFSLPRQDEVSKTVRDLKTQIRLVGHQIDVEAKRPLPRTGFQPGEMSDAARRELAKLNELKRKFGVVVTDPARQLASALQASKTYLRNRMADLRKEMAERTRIVKTRTAITPDAELTAMRAEYDQLKREHEAILPRPELTEAQRVEIAERALDRAISNLESDLKAGKLYADKPTKLTSPELEAKRAHLDALREQRQELRDIANPKKTPLERALQAYKTRTANRIADLQDRLARGDFSTRPKSNLDISNDPVAIKLKTEKEIIERNFERSRVMDQMRNRTLTQKIYAGAKEILNIPRALLSSWDVSAVLRQGGFIGFGHPIRAAKSLIPMFKALASEKSALQTEQQILSRQNAPRYARSKLYLASLDEFRLSKQEEIMMSRFANAIPGVRMSNRAFMTFLNKLRADSFDAMTSALEKRGTELSQPELEAISNYINIATGRGNLGKAAGAAETLATVFFSPRLVASRFQLLAGEPMYRGSARTRALVASEYARFLGGLAVVYGLARLSGAEIEDDPRSADFGKLRFGNTRIDPLAGLAQNTVLLSRLAAGETKTSKGKIKPIRGEKLPFGSATSADVIARFLRTKLNPVVGTSVDVLTGQNVVGEPVTPSSAAINLATPLSFRDIYDVMQDQGIPAATAIQILSLFGMGVQHYEDQNGR